MSPFTGVAFVLLTDSRDGLLPTLFSAPLGVRISSTSVELTQDTRSQQSLPPRNRARRRGTSGGMSSVGCAVEVQGLRCFVSRPQLPVRGRVICSSPRKLIQSELHKGG